MALILKKAGIGNVLALIGGYEEWVKRGDAIVKGDSPRYATSHEALDRDTALQQEVRNTARALVEAVGLSRSGRLPQPGASRDDPQPE